MENQHLTYFKIENFKRFDSFEMNNLGQFNLIVGDNNVGKTSVLEALCFDERAPKFIANYLYAFSNRGYQIQNIERSGNLNILKIPATVFWQTIFKDINKPLNFFTILSDSPFLKASFLNIVSLNDEDKDQIRKTSLGTLSEYRSQNNGSGSGTMSGSGSGSGALTPEYWLRLSSYSGSFEIMPAHIPAFLENKEIHRLDKSFLPANLGYDDDLVAYFYKFFNEQKSIRKQLEKRLKLIVPNLEELRTHRFYEDREMIAFSLKDEDSLQPLTRYGDGTVKIVRLLMGIIINQNGRLMVDEIGSGIHFTRLKDFWKTIIQLCADYNVQLFATTHSLECQHAFVEALDDEDMKLSKDDAGDPKLFKADARNITMLENKEGKVKAFTYNFDEFEFSLANSINTRGGGR